MENRSSKYHIANRSFASLREKGGIYVDKTQFIEKIVNGKKYCFLSRPKGFGKSLFLSTLRVFFEGHRDLFKGLYADSMKWDWEPYPVLYLDLSGLNHEGGKDFATLLNDFFSVYEKLFNITNPSNLASVRFANLIKAAYEKTGKEVVILVDEGEPWTLTPIERNQLNVIYSNFKSSSDYIRLVFVAGVGRFKNTDLFGDSLNIIDISFEKKYATVCGFTETELTSNFNSKIESLAIQGNSSKEKIIEKLKVEYGGYHFSRTSPEIFNPFSFLNLFDKKQFCFYWNEHADISHLLAPTGPNNMYEITCSKREIEWSAPSAPNPISILYHTGYLTIKSYDKESRLYHLTIPNNEAKQLANISPML